MIEKFDDAAINGAFIRKLVFSPTTTVHINILRAPAHASERQVSMISDLRFHEVQRFQCNFDANPWLEIISHTSLPSSDWLTQSQANGNEATPKVNHFQITCDEGTIDIVARHFTISVMEEIPHHGLSE